MDVSVRFILAALRNVWVPISATYPGPPTPASLRAALQAKSDAQFAMVGAGAIGSMTQNEQKVGFKNAGDGAEVSPQQVLDIWVFLIELFDRAVGDLGGTPADPQVETQMETYLRPVTGA